MLEEAKVTLFIESSCVTSVPKIITFTELEQEEQQQQVNNNSGRDKLHVKINLISSVVEILTDRQLKHLLLRYYIENSGYAPRGV